MPRSFPGGAKNPLANAEDTGFIPDLGGSRIPRGSWARVPRLLNLCSTAREPQLLKPLSPGACTLQLESSPFSPKPEKSPGSNHDPAQTKIKK